MTSLRHDRLLVSSVNGGGVFLIEDGVVDRLSKVDTTGMAQVGDTWLWARQTPPSNELRYVGATRLARHVLAPHALDLHDVVRDGADVYAVATQINAVLRLRTDTLEEVERWRFRGEDDSQHLNSACLHAGRLLATRFGDFDTHRGYKGQTKGAGQVLDVRTSEVLLGGLSQPHTLTSCDDLLWVCDSETYSLRAFNDGREWRAWTFDGYVRGLAFGGSYAYVGLSRGRNDPDSTLRSAQILVLDRNTMAIVGRIDLPTDEVYDICLCDTPTLELHEMSRRESLEEIDTVRHERNLATIAMHDERRRVSEHAVALHHARTHAVHLESALADIRRESREAGIRAREEEAWCDMLAAEAVRLGGIVGLHEAVIDRQSQALGALGDAVQARDHALEQRARLLEADRHALYARDQYIDTIHRSRSWRWTRPLRRVEPVAPHAFTAAEIPAVPAPPEQAGDPVAAFGFEPADLGAAPRRGALPILDLAFPEHDAPNVSVVVTAHGHFKQTLSCLRSIVEAGASVPFEVILIEDHSGDAEMERFASVPGLRYVRTSENLGYLRAANEAVRLARGEYVHFLNNDTRVQPDWMDALLRTFALLDRCGAAGSKLVHPDGSLQEAGGIVWSDGSACNYGRGNLPAAADYVAAREVDYVSGASLMVRASLLRELGGYDEYFLPAYYEDTDLAFRIRERGWRVYLQAESVVVHLEGMSHGTDTGFGVKAAQNTNRVRFLTRWRDTLEQAHCAPGQHPFLARDRSQLKKSVLVIDRHAPQPDRDAGSRAIWQLLRVLHQSGFAVSFWSLSVADEGAYVDSLRRHGIEVRIGDAAALESWLRVHGAYIDHVVASRPVVAADCIDAIRLYTQAKLIYYGHDIHHQRIGAHARLSADPALLWQSGIVRRMEESIWPRSDLVLYPIDEETAEVRAWLDANGHHEVAAATVPLFAFEGEPEPVDDGDEPIASRREVLFVGGFGHAPNEDAVKWFVREAWPLVCARHPELRLVLVGADPTPEVLALASDDIEIAGHVPEHKLREHYRRARVAIAPLRFGAGLKGKLVEAMRLGVPCVTTPVGAQGLGDASFLRIADDAAGLETALAGLIDDTEAWRAASRQGQAYVHRRFSAQAIREVLALVMDNEPYSDMAARLRRLAAASAAIALPAS